MENKNIFHLSPNVETRKQKEARKGKEIGSALFPENKLRTYRKTRKDSQYYLNLNVHTITQKLRLLIVATCNNIQTGYKENRKTHTATESGSLDRETAKK